MRCDFNESYECAERAFAKKKYEKAYNYAKDILRNLSQHKSTEKNKEINFATHVKARLLIANIELYGFKHYNTAANLYQQIIDLKTDQLVKDLAQRGLALCEQIKTCEATRTNINPIPIDANRSISGMTSRLLTQDPFIASKPPQTNCIQPQTTAVPWNAATADSSNTTEKSRSSSRPATVNPLTESSRRDIEIQEPATDHQRDPGAKPTEENNPFQLSFIRIKLNQPRPKAE